MLRQRLITAAFGLVIMLGLLVWGQAPWHIALWVGMVIGAIEYCTIMGFDALSVMSFWAYIVVTIIMWWPNWHASIVLQGLVGVTLVLPVILRNRITLPQTASVLVGAVYIGYGGLSLAEIRGLSHGLNWVILLLTCIWVTDSVAYFVGNLVKGPKLWPAISPSKTISGAVAGVLAAAAGAAMVGLLTVPGFDVVAYAVVGAVISITGQIGDLVESAYKRSAGVKDSGRILPGHGGILDRFDSLLFAAPFAYYLVTIGATTWFR